MAATFAAIETLMDAAVAAMAAADYGTARDKALAAQALLSVLPNTSRNSSGGGSDALTWDRVAVSQFVANAIKLANASRGIVESKVRLQPLPGAGVNQLGVWGQGNY
jgi:hypothetical protein